MNMLLLLALAAVRVHAKLVEKTLTARDRQVLEKAKLIDKWFEERRQHPRHEIVGRVRSAAKRASDPWIPPTWNVSKPEDVPEPWQELSGSNHAKQVFRATLHNKSVIIKKKHHDPRGHDLGGMTKNYYISKRYGASRACLNCTEPGSTTPMRRTSSRTAGP